MTEDELNTSKYKPFLYLTNHLIGFRELERIISLVGDEYELIKKSIWYSIFSITIRRKTLTLGDIKSDGRFNLAIPLPSGAGKRNLIDAVTKICKRLNLNLAKPTSFHPEQLVGKTIRHERRNQPTEFEVINGHLADDVVIINEAIELLDNRELAYKESRKYISEALDPVGSNKITKRMVGIPRERQVEYEPSCVMLLFFQPFQLDQDVLLTGFLRRFSVLYVKIKEPDPIVYEQRVRNSPSTESELDSFVFLINSSMHALVNGNEFVFSEEAVKRFVKLHRELLRQGYAHSIKGRNFTKIVHHYLLELLLKMICIQTVVRCDTNVNVRDVELAFIDLTEFFESMLDFVDEKINGDLSYGKRVSFLELQNNECLDWLYDVGAISFENSTVSVKTFIQKIRDICRISEDTANKKYKRLKDKGFIEGRQVGQTNSRVWLTAGGINQIEGSQESKGTTHNTPIKIEFTETEYWKIVKKLQDTT